MLRTLLAQEVRALGRTHLLVLGVAALVATLLVLVGLFDLPVVSSVCQLLAASVLAASVLAVFVHCLVEYWQSMYGQRGYLTMTVPVRGRVLYAAKVVYTVLATAAAALLALALYGAAYAATAWSQDQTVAEAFAPVREAVDLLGAGRILLTAMTLLLMLISWTLMSTALMSVGAQSRWNHLGFGAPVIGFVILYLVSQVVTLLTMLLVPFGVSLTTGDFIFEMMLGPVMDSLSTGAEPDVLGLGFLPATWVLAASLGWWAVRAIERHTSLR
ncbi:hypothetical protein [Actinomyces wuliandei]|uniref:hypothetical protein n=1 Tax=Actinomyces wuliandei TaxID=2057743 RepID=UPI000FDB6FD8|nr:hypothetical protein [Actinomyces wuliandei]